MAESSEISPLLRVLPFKYWGLHPLYFCEVRMLCCHISRALRTIDPGRNDYHILYDQHPITKVEVCGTVVNVASRMDRRVLVLDDGTGTVQCAVYMRHFDGNPSQHYDAKVGDTVIVAGKLAFAWRLNGTNDTCREIRARAIRPVSDANEMFLLQSTALELHANFYSKPVEDMIQLLDRNKLQAAVCARSPAAVALDKFARPPRCMTESGGVSTTSTIPFEPDHARRDGVALSAAKVAADFVRGEDDPAFAGYMLQMLQEIHPHWVRDRSGFTIRSRAYDDHLFTQPEDDSAEAFPAHFTVQDVVQSLFTEAASELWHALLDRDAADIHSKVERGLGDLIEQGHLHALPLASVCDATFSVVSMCETLVPAILAMLTKPPPAHAKRARMPGVESTSTMLQEWTFRDIMDVLHSQPATAKVGRPVVQSCLFKMRDASLILATGHERYMLDPGTKRAYGDSHA